MTGQHRHDLLDTASAAVVVGTDGSPASSHAVAWAAQTAADRGRRLLVVHGYDLAATRAVLGSYEVLVPSVVEHLREHGRQALESAERIAREEHPDLEVTTELSDRNPAELLIELSSTAHLVVLGATPGVGSFAHLGSTLLAVASQGSGRIVVARHNGVKQQVRRGGPVVVGVDGSPIGEPAIEAAFDEACARGAELVVVHAWSDLSEGQFAGTCYLQIPIAELETAEHALLSERLAGWQEKYPTVAVTRRVHLSGARKQLIEWSKSAQLVVVGSRGRGGFRGLLLGSTSNHLVQHAHCPVLVAHSN
ncbi:Nucleotide-binding universal stress protein, UspA family [Nocardia amikacinitolerans]|uniref:Nucleotide-binding universal stress protein, UspA family n=1 Tax=Nocardia amikacinitolerans TaxID=756689 RepID=A0A285L2E0_9NOCA|nr:universal stress protein [Nocardia amikacinitolerans]SNY79064.1 Nucleotide-binding universal stress protein, UspA family [Nocardia amikacinitolerans]